jgi:ATP-dependent DNA ligase
MSLTIKTFEKELEQIENSSANGGGVDLIPDKCWKEDNWVAELKLDGTRLKFHITSEGNRLDTRRISERSGKYMERTNNFPHLRDLDLKELEGTVLDGEGLAPVTEDTMGATQSMVGAGPEHSWEIQERIGQLVYNAFDIIKYKGTDLRKFPYRERHNKLQEVVKSILEKFPDAKINIVRQKTVEKKEYYQSIIARDGEGIMLKDLNAVYGDAKGLLKCKKSKRWTMIITGFKPGDGKHKGKVGSLGIGFHGEPQLTYAGGLSDVLRQDMQDHPTSYLGKVVEIEALEFTKTGSLRHPRVVGSTEGRTSEDIETEKVRIFRIDKAPKDCGRDQNVIVK